MRKADNEARLTKEQEEAAGSGIKAMIPIGRPFLDYVLHGLADAGYREICLVIGPEHDKIRTYYGETVKPNRLKIGFAVQEKPLGTADAVAAGEEFAGEDDFLVINSDNYYPREALEGLRAIEGPGLAVFDRNTMIAESNIPPDRVSKFSVVMTEDGFLRRIIEKPSPEVLDRLPEPIGLSMNCWRFDERIFEACRSISPSPRGELEITDAVQYAIDRLGARFQALPFAAPVLDITSRADIEKVAAKLKGSEVRL
jgi:glucose-1-phosphate thymidylyltransferase